MSSTAIRGLKQPRLRRQQERHEFAYLTVKSNSFARFPRALFMFGYFEDVTFSFFPRRGVTCFAVMWAMWAYDVNFSILRSYFWNVSIKFKDS